MNLRFFISHRYHFHTFTLSIICLGLGFLFLSPANQPAILILNRNARDGLPNPSLGHWIWQSSQSTEAKLRIAANQQPNYSTIKLQDYPTTPRLNYQANPTPTPFTNPTATPPSQAGHGRDVFHVFCMPCHGDVGQGLTEEFRLREYPPEDTNCWKSGCHGARPYENGFTLPKTVPALIGANTLTKFATARSLYDFMRAAMPFNQPASLSQEEYLQVLAYLLEQNQRAPEGVELDLDSLQNIRLQPEAAPTPAADSAAPQDYPSLLLIGVLIVFGAAVILVIVARARSTPARP